ncbi:hypothetical protein RJO15_19815 [Herbaspirillum huttiense F1]|jgi:hypothetical protein|uniref:Uncharacterized protein n=1 Tax=Herbaspirillum huttiense subsp. lycopersici TaxID=3074428 RepID=A0ABU2EPV9_9BURK|nr:MULTISPECIES: hypothetical protein [Herbaspirillum]MBP1317823.1 hypothetical protein [Herbaspirillum sp. 1130]MDR9850159.1 hypothetical protein [Herbaspirillum huttiense SE1]MDT0358045.1 hypothetical protein [Herbaspirillum huttiense F1]
MLVYQHHTGSEIIDFEPENGLWRYPEEEQRTSDLEILARFSLPVRGSYTEVNEKRYYLYWTADRILNLITPDNKTYPLFRHLKEALFEDLSNGLQIVIAPTQNNDGSEKQGYSTVRLSDKDGRILHEVSYNSRYYLELYMSDLTPFTDRTLSTWDFFVALKDGVEKIRKKCVPWPGTIADVVRIRSKSGQTCPKSGFWLVADLVDDKIECKQGDIMPLSLGRDVAWEWISLDIVPRELFLDENEG